MSKRNIQKELLEGYALFVEHMGNMIDFNEFQWTPLVDRVLPASSQKRVAHKRRRVNTYLWFQQDAVIVG